MWKSLSGWIKWSTNDWNMWKDWQRRQMPSHYERCDLFQYYLSQRPNFQPPPEATFDKSLNKYHVYCFGDFTCLINTPIGPANVGDYFRLLLDIYDVCKGMTRIITGDPSGILVLREVVAKNTLTPLQQHDCAKYAYPYTELHAHTICQYSLSTLIMRLVMHYMSKLTPKFNDYSINDKLCQQAYDKCIFGTPVSPRLNSTTIDNSIVNSINKIAPEVHDKKSQSTSGPYDISLHLRCKICKRVTEHVWGKFSACLDCHLKRVCSTCAAVATIIALDNLPKCKDHQEV